MGTSYYFPSYQYSLKDHVLVKTSPVFTMARLAGKLVPGISQLDLDLVFRSSTRWNVGPPWPQ